MSVSGTCGRGSSRHKKCHRQNAWLVPKARDVQVSVEGTQALKPETDICIAGLGWVSVGLWGKATLKVWTPPGIAVTRRTALLPDLAKEFERPGWSNNSKSLFIKDTSKSATRPKERKKKKNRRGPVTHKKAKSATPWG